MGQFCDKNDRKKQQSRASPVTGESLLFVFGHWLPNFISTL